MILRDLKAKNEGKWGYNGKKIAYKWDIMVIFHGDTGYSGDNQQTSLVGLNGKICGKIIFNLGTYMGTPASNGDVNLNDRGKIMVIYIYIIQIFHEATCGEFSTIQNRDILAI